MNNNRRKEIRRIPFGSVTKSKQTVFLAIVCRETFGHENKRCVSVLMINRSDGRFSFPGGGVESGECLIDAAIREVKEEIDFSCECEDMTEVCSHQIFTVDMHLYCMFVSYKKMIEIQTNAFRAEHFGTEVVGTNLVHIVDYGGGKGLSYFLGNHFVDGVSEQLFVLVKEQALMDIDQLTSCYNQAGKMPYPYQKEVM